LSSAFLIILQNVKDCIAAIKTRLGIPLKNTLHWRKHCTRHEFRKYVTGEIAKLQEVTVIYVISDKKTTPIDHAFFYNAVAALTLERILKHTEKMNTKVSVWFGHVWIPSENNTGIQLADQYCGILGAAMLIVYIK